MKGMKSGSERQLVAKAQLLAAKIESISRVVDIGRNIVKSGKKK
jgi:hypothetical protein